MNSRLTRVAVALGVLMLATGAHPAAAQQWSVDVAAGETVFDPITTAIGTRNLMGSLRYDARRDAWVYGAAAVPLRSGDPFWTVLGAGGRVTAASSQAGGIRLGVDLGGHAYHFRDRVVDRTGTGGTVQVMPFTRVSGRQAALEVRGGWRGHALSYAGATAQRGVFEAGARATYGRTLQVGADAHVVRAGDGSFPFAGASVAYSGADLHVWANAGRWLHDQLDDVTWNAGAAYAVSRRVRLWTGIRQDGRDPLYWNAARRSWSVGATTRLGRLPALRLPAPPVEAGRVVIRIPVAEAPGAALYVAGSFNEWQPVRMTREGRDWVLRVPLAPGVYRYAFRSADGDWFVPASVAGRRDDGMGGHVAVMVVS